MTPNSVDDKGGNKHHGASVGGLGSLLYSVHSARRTLLTCFLEETDLEFYEHAVIARLTTQWWCFPKRYFMEIIPRFKIVDVTCSLGPRSIPKLLSFVIIVAVITLIALAAFVPGNETACAVMATMLCIYLALIIVIPWLRKWQYINFNVRKPVSSRCFFSHGDTVPYSFRLKKTASDVRSTLKTGPHVESDNVSFDEMFIGKYVYGSLAMGGVKATSQAHIFSHFNNASLSTPIMPVYADKTIAELVVPKLLQHRPMLRHPLPKSMKEDPVVGRSDVHEGRFVDIESGITPPLTPVSHAPATFKHDLRD